MGMPMSHAAVRLFVLLKFADVLGAGHRSGWATASLPNQLQRRRLDMRSRVAELMRLSRKFASVTQAGIQPPA